MSDFPQGTDWWKASDGLWYPPQDISESIAPSDAAPAAESAPLRITWFGITVVLVVAVGVFLLVYEAASGGGNNHYVDTNNEQDRYSAVAACRDFVEDRLRAPATANHPRNSGQAVVTGDRFKVTSYVDAENAFGGNIRTHYTCTLQDAGDTWRLVSLDLD